MSDKGTEVNEVGIEDAVCYLHEIDETLKLILHHLSTPTEKPVAEAPPPESPAAGPWQTENAPKDGTWFLGLHGNALCIVRWQDDHWRQAPNEKHDREPRAWASIALPKKQEKDDE